MKFEVGKTYLTRSGEKAIVLCVDAPNKQPLVVLHMSDGEPNNHGVDGRFYTEGEKSRFDLVSEYVEPPKPRELWVFPYTEDRYGTAMSDSERTRLMSDDPSYAAKMVKFREVIEA